MKSWGVEVGVSIPFDFINTLVHTLHYKLMYKAIDVYSFVERVGEAEVYKGVGWFGWGDCVAHQGGYKCL